MHPGQLATVGIVGDAAAETCTLIYTRDGEPSYGILFALTGDGSRVLCKSDGPARMRGMAAEGFLGSPLRVRRDRRLEL